MLLRYNFFFLYCLLCSSLSLSKESIKFTPKVSLYSLKSFNEEKDYWFFQGSDNSLKFSQGIKSKLIFPPKDHQHFEIQDSYSDYLLISKDSHFITQLNFFKEKDFYIIKKNGENLKFIEKANDAQINMTGDIVSLINSKAKKISFYLTPTLRKLKTISYETGSYKLFTPSVQMDSAMNVYFTQISKNQGYKLSYQSSKNKKITTLYSTKRANQKIDFCLNTDQELYIKISKLEKETRSQSFILNPDMKKIYSTGGNIISELYCTKKELIFVQENTQERDTSFSLIKISNQKITEVHKSSELISIIQGKYFITKLKAYKIL